MAIIFSKYRFAKKKVPQFIDIIQYMYIDLIHEYLGTVTALMPVV